MSPYTRQRRHTQNQMTSPLIIATSSNDRVEKAKEAVCSLNLSEDKTEHIREVWQELRRSYEATSSNAYDCQPFPFWALQQFESARLERIFTLAYHADLGQLKIWTACAARKFDVRPWRFILFFDSIGQTKARALGKISRLRPSLTFNLLYEEVQRNRSRRIEHQKNPKYELQLIDFDTCWKRGDNGDGSDAEFIDNPDDVEESEIENEEDEDSEPDKSFWSPIESTGLDEQESNYVVVHDVQTRSNHGEDHAEGNREVRGHLDNGPGYPVYMSLPGSPVDIPDETDASGETMIPITPTHTGNERTEKAGATYRSQDMDSMAMASTMGNTPRVTAYQAEEEASGQDTNCDESSSLVPYSNTGNIISVKKRLLQDGQSIFLKLNKLETATEIAEDRVKVIEEKNDEKLEQMKQTARQVFHSNQSASSEDIIFAISDIISDMEREHKKRKMEQDKIAKTSAKKAKLAAQLTAKIDEFEALCKSDVQCREAASANSPT